MKNDSYYLSYAKHPLINLKIISLKINNSNILFPHEFI